MSLLDDMHSEQKATVKGPRCTVCTAVESLSKQDRADLEQALEDKFIFSTVIVRVLAKRGIEVSEAAVSRHRHKRCRG